MEYDLYRIDTGRGKGVTIQFDGVSFRYGPNEDWVLRGINLTITPGERIAIVGSNGCGKSTLGLLMNALLAPTEGEVYVYGQNTRSPSDLAEIRQRVGYVFQNPDQQLISNTIEDDIAFGLENLGVSPSEQERRIHGVMRTMRLDVLKHMDPNSLSPGQKQKLAVAGVIAMEPDAIVFDEAVSMQSPRDAESLRQIIDGIHKKGTTIVQITHDMEELYDCDRALVMKDGAIAMDGSPIDIFSGSRTWQEARLLPPFAVRVREALTDRGIRFMAGICTEDDLVKRICEYVSRT
ncbi:MAG: transporter related protein [Paenibacillus sp.]|jgi:energy-coupling factor transport system ATP-binding protein|nr:transporter related protein [Paenibacillus sp.]